MDTLYHQKRPLMSDEGLAAAVEAVAVDEYGDIRNGHVAAERALTLYLDKQELVTLMTLGTRPEMLVLGWLRNQRLVEDIEQIKAIQVDWETDSVAITTYQGVQGLKEKMARKTVTTGCGQGTVFGDLMDDLDKIELPRRSIRQSEIYRLLHTLNEHNQVYQRAGAVHGCALCSEEQIHLFIEDVGRHNAVDAIAGHMWLEGTDGSDKLFYTTGRLTSEMVIKVAQMGIPILLSRSGITQMGLELAKKVGVTLIARAKGRHFLVYNGAEQISFDAVPEVRPRSTGSRHASQSKSR
ncbi:formate dehydrogenase accessory sulfurtransferase FdhD [Candidatus Thiodiazotropha sp. CDECU1]|uniref:formate dehydrogenase accessory sulfurtransferase FdhD n=1 Tax=Candidatus Thiodiazotropha sp. CDECU1 TaxID=3065865 RepID=UPI00292E4E0B|nr:formate dehydrogenase accessory sulfurtransferase FdhD [Candidatus Thiodiazotropha sp. CDECU1]